MNFNRPGYPPYEPSSPGLERVPPERRFPAPDRPLPRPLARTRGTIHTRRQPTTLGCRSAQAGYLSKSRLPIVAIGTLLLSVVSFAQEKPALIMEHDCRTFAISSNNKIVCSVPHLKRIKKVVITRDDVWLATPNGHEKQIVEGDRFMPVPPPSSYTVDSLAWAPDGGRIAMIRLMIRNLVRPGEVASSGPLSRS